MGAVDRPVVQAGRPERAAVADALGEDPPGVTGGVAVLADGAEHLAVVVRAAARRSRTASGSPSSRASGGGSVGGGPRSNFYPHGGARGFDGADAGQRRARRRGRPGRGRGAARDPGRRRAGRGDDADAGRRRGAGARVPPRRGADRRPARAAGPSADLAANVVEVAGPLARDAGGAPLLHDLLVRGLRQGGARGGRGPRSGGAAGADGLAAAARRPPRSPRAAGVRAQRRPPRDRAVHRRRRARLRPRGRRPPQRDGQGDRLGAARGPRAALRLDPLRQRPARVRARPEGGRRGLPGARRRRRADLARDRARRRPRDDAGRVRARRQRQRLQRGDRATTAIVRAQTRPWPATSSRPRVLDLDVVWDVEPVASPGDRCRRRISRPRRRRRVFSSWGEAWESFEFDHEDCRSAGDG